MFASRHSHPLGLGWNSSGPPIRRMWNALLALMHRRPVVLAKSNSHLRNHNSETKYLNKYLLISSSGLKPEENTVWTWQGIGSGCTVLKKWRRGCSSVPPEEISKLMSTSFAEMLQKLERERKKVKIIDSWPVIVNGPLWFLLTVDWIKVWQNPKTAIFKQELDNVWFF